MGWLQFGTIDTYEIQNWDDYTGDIPAIEKRGIALDFIGFARMEPVSECTDLCTTHEAKISFEPPSENFFDQHE